MTKDWKISFIDPHYESIINPLVSLFFISFRIRVNRRSLASCCGRVLVAGERFVTEVWRWWAKGCCRGLPDGGSSEAKTLYQGERCLGEGLSVSGREITFLPTYAFISWGQLTAKRLETLRFLSYCDVEEGNGGGGVVFSRGTGFLVSRSTDRDLGKLG